PLYGGGAAASVDASPFFFSVLLQESFVICCHLLAIFANAKTTKIRIISGKLRPLLHRPFCLESIKALAFPSLPLLLLVFLLPQLVPVLAKRVASSSFVADDNFSTHMD